eukprot:TRINITY_DN1468_c0_g1_i1.p1 TRINITY_DN1468_c0_g1~~TRINITY_DN1468_c0_g1_i1.p1  ORF type:complete len:294 (+),score=78.17 TRINITY_DN1468_c0_g1_i1:197-1078(+)
MVLTKEYRIPMPLSVEEYRIAQLYIVAKISKQNTGHGEGIEILENRPYEDETGKGQYTHKIIYLSSRVPSWLTYIMPAGALQVDEKAWNAYPYCKTVYSVPFLGDRFKLAVTTRYLPDCASTENPNNLNAQQLKERTIDVVDIVNDPIDPAKYKAEEDPSLYVSEKTGRGKLKKDWMKTSEPVMTSYKHCEVEFRYWGLQSRVEQFIHKVALRDVFLSGHRQAVCWMDEWYGLTMDDIRQIEEETKLELDKLRKQDDPNGASSSTSPSASPSSRTPQTKHEEKSPSTPNSERK